MGARIADPRSASNVGRGTPLHPWASAAARWMPTFLGFPAGGLAAKLLVGRVDHLAPAVLGGALSGAILGLVQSLALRRAGVSPLRWGLATAAGFAAGLAAGAAAVGYRTDPASLAWQGAFCGFAVGAAQAVALRRELGPRAVAWPVVLGGLWALGWTITSSVGVDVEAQYTVFGSSGALVVTAASSVLAIVVDRRTRSAR